MKKSLRASSILGSSEQAGVVDVKQQEATPFEHVPVLLAGVIEHLRPSEGELFVDATLGGGGHSEAILQRLGPSGKLIGIDQDESALAAAKARLAPFGDQLMTVHHNFVDLESILRDHGVERVDGMLFDFGVSSPQLDQAERGFSFHTDAPLDMRMNQDDEIDAAYLVNTLSQRELTRIIRQYGEERWAHRIAGTIVSERRKSRVETTGQLVEIVKTAIPAAARREGPHPARRTFQALRIAVNRELDVISEVLPQAIRMLRPGGRLVVISFHSLEDRIVKQVFRKAENPCTCPPQLPICQCKQERTLRVLTRQPIVADETEIQRNPRSRSAKLRAAERVLLAGESE